MKMSGWLAGLNVNGALAALVKVRLLTKVIRFASTQVAQNQLYSRCTESQTREKARKECKIWATQNFFFFLSASMGQNCLWFLKIFPESRLVSSGQCCNSRWYWPMVWDLAIEKADSSKVFVTVGGENCLQFLKVFPKDQEFGHGTRDGFTNPDGVSLSD